MASTSDLADELAAMLDEATGTEGIVLRAVLLVAAVPSQALTRRDGGPQDRIKREERNGAAYWTVTLNGRADAERADEAGIDRALWRGRLRMAPIIRGR